MIIDTLKKYLTKSCLQRAGKTFVEAALSYIIINLDTLFSADKSTIKTIGGGILMSAIAAGISAVWNLKKQDVQVTI